VAFQRRKPAAIGAEAPFPGFIEPALAASTEKLPSGERDGFTKSSSTAADT
jgi:bifunctional non-homologous end joining protein LigD